MEKKTSINIQISPFSWAYVYIGTGILLFVLSIMFLVLVLGGWGYSEISQAESDSFVEVKLPIIKWGKYGELSKSKNIDSI